MSRFTLWRNLLAGQPGADYRVMGTYPGDTEAEAFDAMAVEQGFANHVEEWKAKGLCRDDHKAKENP